MKKTAKTKKPLYTVDLTGTIGNDVMEMKYRFICAKADAGVVLTQAERKFLAEYTLESCADVIFGDAPIAFRLGPTTFMKGYSVATVFPKKKKPNIFKRFWNWLTRKNK